MKTALLFLVMVIPSLVWAQSESCIACHEDQAAQMKGDIHAAQALSCVNCHGGNGAVADPEE